jgi:hypothetical protein
MVKKIISGGQSGADQAGLEAGVKLGLQTGGTMPRGFRTLNGPRPDFAQKYGIEESTSWNYAVRTASNVKDSDGTVRFAQDFDSAGERCTANAIHLFRRPSFDVRFEDMSPETISSFKKWLEANNISTLNVAGNSENT